MNTLVEVLKNLRRCIEDAEHKPGQWASARSEMGGITTAVAVPEEADVSGLVDALRDRSWAGFSHKRDSWLAVEAVNALPVLMALAEAALTQAAEPGEKGDAARGLLAGLCENPGLMVHGEPALSKDEGEAIGSLDASVDAAVRSDDTESEGARMIVAERRRQRSVEGWTAAHDDEHTDRSMAMVCALYAAPIPLYEMTGGRGSFHFVDPWPDSWSGEWDKRRVNADGSMKQRSLDEQVVDLTKAGALAAAEIDRLLRLRRGKKRKVARSSVS